MSKHLVTTGSVSNHRLVCQYKQCLVNSNKGRNKAMMSLLSIQMSNHFVTVGKQTEFVCQYKQSLVNNKCPFFLMIS